MVKIVGTKEVFFEKIKRYCAYQDRCQQEVIDKMRELKIDPEWQDEIIVSLIQDDYINEERFAKSIVRGKFNQKSWGRMKIRQFLFQKNITLYLIEKSLSEIDETDYRNRILALIEKKKTQFEKEDDMIVKSKLLNYLIQKGYEAGLVNQCISDNQ